ncbi:monovalent cation/H(+) antiporter subunit G [Pseudohaliea rubra]|uniref:Na(+) H(+) antiporter subunit G n=1 Tax=Pseudohaliea rubra DSM 19751 TaxID=1265313 RepID=A0A095VQ07_9GAMM|nr:monovalent cation/H(+) antiporter subunit G [Pseudohaliea rubra]KGE03542.1 Na(+) H(+) antiporter subunit G [Pseudohaliea rubra DSM 19751]
MASVIDMISFALLAAGGFCVFVGGVGVLRLPDLYTRMHAASITDTAGPLLVLAGLALQAGWSLALFKLAVILVFLAVTAPTAAYALGNAALVSGYRPAVVSDESGATDSEGEGHA